MGKKQIEESRSIESLIYSIDNAKIVLPEFQRDYKWPIEKTEVLFDSIFKGLFIGSLILSKPKFDLACKKIDIRERGSRKHKPKPSKFEISDFENKDIYALLDGQQRITSIYRALKGPDLIYVEFIDLKTLLLEENYDYQNDEPKINVEDFIDGFSSDKPSKGVFYISLCDLYKNLENREKAFIANCVTPRIVELYNLTENDIEVLSSYALKLREYFKSYIIKESSLLSVQLLDMDLEKFCLYFERSNSQGLNLSFIDIITAKIYVDYKLSDAIEKAKENSLFNDKLVEPVVRYLNFLENNEVTRKSILKDLTSNSFKNNWDAVVKDIVKIQEWLIDENIVFSSFSIPYRTMLLPILSFYQNLPNKSFSQASTEQLDLLKTWFYSSIFDSRYGGARHGSTNVVIKEDCILMRKLAKGEKPPKEYWDKLKIEYSKNEILRITSNSSAKFLVIQYYIFNESRFKHLENNRDLSFNDKVDVHHIFPSNYLRKEFGENSEEFDFSDSVLNKIYLNKISNIKISDKKPSKYLSEIRDKNSDIIESLKTHSIPNADKLIDGYYDKKFKEFLEDRYELISNSLEKLKFTLSTLQS